MDELALQVTDRPDAGTVTAVEGLLARARAADGHDGLSEPMRQRLHRAAPRAPTATDGPDDPELAAAPARPVGPGAVGTGFLAVLARSGRPGEPVGYAQVDLHGHDGAVVLELVVDPEHRRGGPAVADALLEAALEAAQEAFAPDPGRPVRLWAHHADRDDDRLARDHGFRPERELVQMRRPLPVEGRRPPFAVRPFVPGSDEGAWLAVNNRAFVGHPEQGGWDLATLAAREAEPWFDPRGFLLHEEEGRLAASCWTKVHASDSPPLGEIYVIAVDPDFRGRGLGRAMTLAGLDWLAGTGLRSGMLYVDGANEAAVALYRSLGFTVDHVDRSYVHRPGTDGRR